MASDFEQYTNLLSGDKLYQRRASRALPYLVNLAKAANKITYSELAELLEMSMAINLNYVLGFIGDALSKLSKLRGAPIPTIQFLVVNKATDMPGRGFDVYFTSVDPSRLDKLGKYRLVQAMLAAVFTYPHWDSILSMLGLEPVQHITKEELIRAGNLGGSGESEAHKLFKLYVAANPHVVGLDNIRSVETESPLPSGDRIDVLFERPEETIAVEVKSFISSQDDILRGLYQCVKYKSVLEAKKISLNQYPNCRAILALQGQLPSNLKRIQLLLSLEVVENIVCP